jgi:hypothetical protein
VTAVCPPEDAPLAERLRWSWRNAYYRGITLYTAGVATLVAVLQLTGTGC